jgi:hypothetical protein
MEIILIFEDLFFIKFHLNQKRFDFFLTKLYKKK